MRPRIKRGTLEKEKAPDGNVFVVVETDKTAQSRPVDDQANDWARAQALINARLEDEVEYLRQQLDHLHTELSRRAEEHAEEIRRRDHLLAAALEPIPSIEPPPNASPESQDVREPASKVPGGDEGGEEPA